MKRKQEGDFSHCNSRGDRGILSMEGVKETERTQVSF
jgi:hypothetical protein